MFIKNLTPASTMQKTCDYCFAVVHEGGLSNHLYMKSAGNAHYYSRKKKKKKAEEEVEDVISIYDNSSNEEDIMFESHEEEDP